MQECVVRRGTAASRRTAVASAFVAVALFATACQGSTDDAPSGSAGSVSSSSSPQPSVDTTPAALTMSPVDQATGVLPNQAVTVTATTGSLGAVTLAETGKSTKVAGTVDASGVWKASSRLRPDTAYTLTVQATGPTGFATTTTSSFRTLKPRITATYSLIGNGATVGVGMPVIVQFDSVVSTKAQRAEVEKSLKVTSVPAQVGAWGWLDNRQLMYRPRTYWKAGTKLSLSAPLAGLQTGDGKWVAKDATGSWNVGSAMISSVNMKTHQMTVTRNGVVLRRFPVSTGRPGPQTETRYGTKVIIERNSAITMDSTTIGIPKGKPGYYKIDTKWNLRVTWTGEFLHSAPWSTGAQGTANVSHGCTNMAPAAAQWMYNNSKIGDVVTFTGSGRAMAPTDGIGVWVYSYAGWKAQSALV